MRPCRGRDAGSALAVAAQARLCWCPAYLYRRPLPPSWGLAARGAPPRARIQALELEVRAEEIEALDSWGKAPEGRWHVHWRNAVRDHEWRQPGGVAPFFQEDLQ